MVLKKKIKFQVLYFFLRIFLGGVFVTCRWKVEGLSELKKALNNNKPIMLCSWHRELLYVARYFKNSSFQIHGISSTHFDSEVLGKLLSSWKIKLIKGSSTRGWVNVLKKIITLSKNSSNIIVLNNDGPKGPPLVAKGGSLAAADKYGYQVVVMSGMSSNQWRVSSWDRTFVPKPFGIIKIKFSKIYPSDREINVKNITSFINNNNLYGSGSND